MKVQGTSKKQIIEESKGAILRVDGYPMKARELLQTALHHTSWTFGQDAYRPALATTFGLFSLLMLGDLVQCPTNLKVLPAQTMPPRQTRGGQRGLGHPTDCDRIRSA